ncbi:MAG: hypothetical protein LBQ09_06345 [Acidobacteriaceae bacterium]|jgi:hypothetical protein|nr:hypothetical protein [Acidobacteriaceae bacterium]
MTIRGNFKAQIFVLMAVMTAWTIPFVVLLCRRFDVVNESLSAIGWRLDGMAFLAFYIFALDPIMIYSARLFLKLLNKKSPLLMALVTIGCALVTIGIFIPVRPWQLGTINDIMHDNTCKTGAGIVVISCGYMMVLLVREDKQNYKQVVAACLGVAFLLWSCVHFYGTAALAEVAVSHLLVGVALYMCFTIRNGVNRATDHPVCLSSGDAVYSTGIIEN